MAFIVTLPNINEAIRDLNGGCFRSAWRKLLWRLKVQGAQIGARAADGRAAQAAGTVMGSALPLQLIGAIWPERDRSFGYPLVELSWILENNRPDAQHPRTAGRQGLQDLSYLRQGAGMSGPCRHDPRPVRDFNQSAMNRVRKWLKAAFASRSRASATARAH